jgi:hypothetical protein
VAAASGTAIEREVKKGKKKEPGIIMINDNE